MSYVQARRVKIIEAIKQGQLLANNVRLGIVIPRINEVFAVCLKLNQIKAWMAITAEIQARSIVNRQLFGAIPLIH